MSDRPNLLPPEAVEAAAQELYGPMGDDGAVDSAYWASAQRAAYRALAAAMPAIRAHIAEELRCGADQTTLPAIVVGSVEMPVNDSFEGDPMVGYSLWFDRESWGVITDALIDHYQSASRRKRVNPHSTSDARVAMCSDLIRKINKRSDEVLACGGDQHG